MPPSFRISKALKHYGLTDALYAGLTPIRINKTLKQRVCAMYLRISLTPFRVNKALKQMWRTICI